MIGGNRLVLISPLFRIVNYLLRSIEKKDIIK